MCPFITGLFHSTWCFLGPSVWHHGPELPSFLSRRTSHCKVGRHCVYPFTLQCTSGLLLAFGCWERGRTKISLNPCFRSSGYKPRDGIAASWRDSMWGVFVCSFCFLRNRHTVFQSSCSILHSFISSSFPIRRDIPLLSKPVESWFSVPCSQKHPPYYR